MCHIGYIPEAYVFEQVPERSFSTSLLLKVKDNILKVFSSLRSLNTMQMEKFT